MNTALLLTALATIMTTPQQSPKWVLTLDEDFNGPAGTAANPKVWKHDIGGNGWGNQEWEYYTEGSKNAFMDGKGNLVIEARKEKFEGKDYTSSRLLTKGLFSQQFGKVEARIKLPQGKGIWPAFWMMSDDIDKLGWPNGGEIDIMEFLGHDPRTVYGTLHGPGYSGAEGISQKKQLPEGGSYLDDFHVFAVEWEKDRIAWMVDGKVVREFTPKDIPGKEWAFNRKFFLILNVAVGGGWPGYPNETTKFPQRMLVDYVKVYKKA